MIEVVKTNLIKYGTFIVGGT